MYKKIFNEKRKRYTSPFLRLHIMKVFTLIIVGIMISNSYHFIGNNQKTTKNNLEGIQNQIYSQSDSYGSDTDNDQFVSYINYIGAERVWSGTDGGIKPKNVPTKLRIAY